ncbi:MAG: hypothetical protein LIP01_09460 [Tannerellaceae bacterium]|nr:hypothetical protein [Tannerellaceae bacterium]
MINHLFRIIWNQRSANVLILIELFLVFILLWVCNYQLWVYINRLNEPLGFDYKHVYVVTPQSFPREYPAWQEGRNEVEDYFAFADRLRSCPGVEAVSISSDALPFAPYSSSIPLSSDNGTSFPRLGEIMPEFIDVFCLNPMNSSVNLKKELVENHFIISQETRNELFPEGSGSDVFYIGENKEKAYRTNGIIKPVKQTEYSKNLLSCISIYPGMK